MQSLYFCNTFIFRKISFQEKNYFFTTEVSVFFKHNTILTQKVDKSNSNFSLVKLWAEGISGSSQENHC